MSGNPAPESPVERLVLALKDPYHLFTRPQVAYLMAGAARWAVDGATYDHAYAYELGRKAALREVADLNLAAIEFAIDASAMSAAATESDLTRRARREAAAAAAALPRDGDFLGWGEDPAAHEQGAQLVLASWGLDEDGT